MDTEPMLTLMLFTWVGSFVIGLSSVWLMRWASHRIGLVDRPDPTRKLHRGDIAVGGGVAILVGSAIAVLATHFWLLPSLGDLSGLPWNHRWTVLAVALVLITIVGVVDDREAMRGKSKLLFQVAISGLVASFWVPTGAISLFHWTIDIGAVSGPLLMLWLLLAINSVNLIDGADGVTGSFGVIAGLGIGVVGWLNGNLTAAILGMVLSAAIAGFLIFNRPPATIFLGDAGSMLIGLAFGGLSILAVGDGRGSQDILIPIALIAVPLFDSAVAVLRRVLTGRSIYTADRGHLHHLVASQLASRGWSPVVMLAIFGGLTAVTSMGAILGVAFSSDLYPIASIVLVVAGLVGFRIFGHAEAQLLASHTRRLGGGMLSRGGKGTPQVHVAGVSLQGERQWDGVWGPLVDFAEKNDLWYLRLDLNMPWRHEGYHGAWIRKPLPDRSEQWSVKLPIICNGRVVGRLDIAGQAAGTSQIESLESFSFLIQELQPAIERLVCSIGERVETKGKSVATSDLVPAGY
jgi:UDP-GlcNAc:undecaprenyl-phosphate/decaprenyl-phosphate GlcNAc-1-phosphate transferase